MTKNIYSINYSKKELAITVNGEFHKFDLTEGDLSDYWNSFEDANQQMWDVNFYQEDETCEPSVCVYECIWSEESGGWEIQTESYYVLDQVGVTGTPKEYFESWNAPVKKGDIIGGRFKVSNIIPPIQDKVLIQKNRELKQTIHIIIEKINACGIGAWNADLESAIEAVACEDFYGDTEQEEPTIKYNGWYEDLLKLKEIL